MAKNFDVKQFLLEKGERVGLAIAVGVALVLVGLGAWSGFSSASPTETAADIRQKAEKINNTIQVGEPLSDPKVDPVIMQELTSTTVDLRQFVQNTRPFIETGRENDKYRNPEILAPVEFVPSVFRAQTKIYLVSQQGERMRVGVLIPKEAKKDEKADAAKYALSRWMASGGKTPPPMLRGFDPASYMKIYMEAQRQAQGGGEFTAKPENQLDFVDAGKIPTGAKFAETVQPQRMVIVSASFPYHSQLELYRAALNKRNLTELVGSREDVMPNFLKLNVRRRAVDPSTGRPLQKENDGWVAIDYDRDYRLSVLRYAVESKRLEAAEEASMKPFVLPNLVWPRPILARGAYPKPGLKELDTAMKLLAEKTAVSAPPVTTTQLERQLRGEEPQDEVASFENPKGPMAPRNPGADPPPGDEPKATAEPLVPKHVLVRFIDANIEPGATYQYQVQVRVQNPNYGKKEVVAYPALADARELASEWAPTDPKQCQIGIDRELYYYAADTETVTKDKNEGRPRTAPQWVPDKDAAYVQSHRWLEKVRLSPDNATSLLPVGDWSIAYMPVRRGEFISRTEQVDLPIWFPTREGFDFAVPLQPAVKVNPLMRPPAQAKGIPVSFETPDLVVDWEGGSVFQNFRMPDGKTKEAREEAPLELLVMQPDGSLRVLNSRLDAKNPDRETRYQEWKKLIQDTRDKKKPANVGDPFKKKP